MARWLSVLWRRRRLTETTKATGSIPTVTRRLFTSARSSARRPPLAGLLDRLLSPIEQRVGFGGGKGGDFGVVTERQNFMSP